MCNYWTWILVEVMKLAISNVRRDYCNISVSVTTGLFMEESSSVHKLMHDDVIIHASVPKRNWLTASATTNVAIASGKYFCFYDLSEKKTEMNATCSIKPLNMFTNKHYLNQVGENIYIVTNWNSLNVEVNSNRLPRSYDVTHTKCCQC